MTTLRNNFEGGPHGTILSTTNSGQHGDSAFNAIGTTTGTGVLNQFADITVSGLIRPTAEFAWKTATGSTPVTPYVAWTTSMGSKTQIWTRFYWNTASLSLTSDNNVNLFTAYNTASAAWGVAVWLNQLSDPHALFIYNMFTGAQVVMTTLPSIGDWNRVEVRATLSTTIGSADLYLYRGDIADTDTPSDVVSMAGQNFGTGTANAYILGPAFSVANMDAMYFSNWEVNDTGYPGPAPFRAGRGVPSGNMTNPIVVHSGSS
jgi:hypothetical protein